MQSIFLVPLLTKLLSPHFGDFLQANVICFLAVLHLSPIGTLVCGHIAVLYASSHSFSRFGLSILNILAVVWSILLGGLVVNIIPGSDLEIGTSSRSFSPFLAASIDDSSLIYAARIRIRVSVSEGYGYADT